MNEQALGARLGALGTNSNSDLTWPLPCFARPLFLLFFVMMECLCCTTGGRACICRLGKVASKSRVDAWRRAFLKTNPRGSLGLPGCALPVCPHFMNLRMEWMGQNVRFCHLQGRLLMVGAFSTLDAAFKACIAAVQSSTLCIDVC